MFKMLLKLAIILITINVTKYIQIISLDQITKPTPDIRLILYFECQ